MSALESLLEMAAGELEGEHEVGFCNCGGVVEKRGRRWICKSCGTRYEANPSAATVGRVGPKQGHHTNTQGSNWDKHTDRRPGAAEKKNRRMKGRKREREFEGELELAAELMEGGEFETKRTGQATVDWKGPYTVANAIKLGTGRKGLYVIYRNNQVVDSGKTENQDLATRIRQHFEFPARHQEPLTNYRVSLGFMSRASSINLAEGTVTRSLAKKGDIPEFRKDPAGVKRRVPNTAQFRAVGTRGVQITHRGSSRAVPKSLRGYATKGKGGYVQRIGKGKLWEAELEAAAQELEGSSLESEAAELEAELGEQMFGWLRRWKRPPTTTSTPSTPAAPMSRSLAGSVYRGGQRPPRIDVIRDARAAAARLRQAQKALEDARKQRDAANAAMDTEMRLSGGDFRQIDPSVREELVRAEAELQRAQNELNSARAAFDSIMRQRRERAWV